MNPLTWPRRVQIAAMLFLLLAVIVIFDRDRETRTNEMRVASDDPKSTPIKFRNHASIAPALMSLEMLMHHFEHAEGGRLHWTAPTIEQEDGMTYETASWAGGTLMIAHRDGEVYFLQYVTRMLPNEPRVIDNGIRPGGVLMSAVFAAYSPGFKTSGSEAFVRIAAAAWSIGKTRNELDPHNEGPRAWVSFEHWNDCVRARCDGLTLTVEWFPEASFLPVKLASNIWEE